MRFNVLFSLVGCVVLGCGGGSNGGKGGRLDCAWLESENCWKGTASQATTCVAPASETGTLSADNKTCTYASGVVVTFSPAMVLPVPADPTWNFTIARAGQTCLHYQDTNTGFSLTVGSDKVTEGLSGSIGLKVTCPDGTAYANANAFELFSCGADGGTLFGGLPGHSWSSGGGRVTFGLVSTSSSSSSGVQLFNCGR